MVKLRKSIVVGAAFAASFGAGFAVNQAVADQPMMTRALESLQVARGSLQRAANNKGGHRVEAIRHIDAAIAEVKAGMEFDRKH